jgi:hypothetical protein
MFVPSWASLRSAQPTFAANLRLGAKLIPGAKEAAEQLSELFEADAVGPMAGFPQAPSERS